MVLSKTLPALAAFAASIILLTGGLHAEQTWHHALSLVGKPNYPAGFENFKWVNPQAPKGGLIRIHSIGTFDSLNQFPVKGNSASGLSLMYDTLMAGSPDEPSAEYGLIAEAVSFPDDYSYAIFRLRPQARFHDGEPVKPEDVIFSFNAIKKVSPNSNFYYKNVVRAEKTGDHEVTFHFDVKGNRELPQIIGQLSILPKHYWSAKNGDGEPRDLARTTLEPPLASGPYKIKEVRAGRSITYERVADYWAKDLPVARGKWNFGALRIEYFRDTTVAFEAFKAGQLDWFQESSSKNWATAYDFKAIRNGWVKKEEIALKRSAPMQAFVMNTRLAKYADKRVRQAFNLAYDFEWSNKNLFYGQYKRVGSYFENSELASSGLPEGREKEILQQLSKEFPGHVPEEALTKEYKNPENNNRDAFRKNLRKASQLLRQAGWIVKDGVRVNAKTGETLEAEFMIVSPAFERVVLPYIQNLKRLGIKSNMRIIDSSQYRARLDAFDFDIIVGVFPQSESPGNEQRDFWGTAAADKNGSLNLIGIRNPAIDKLIEMLVFAKSREELVTLTHVLDRVLLAHHFLIPQWFSPNSRIAYWNRYGRPETLPSQSVSFTQIWWLDAAKTAHLEAAVK